MVVKRKARKVKAESLFDPDAIAIQIHQAICRDLFSIKQKYDATHPIGYLANVQTSKLLKKYTAANVDQNPLVDLTYEKFHAVNAHMAGFSTPYGAGFGTSVLSTTPVLEAILLKARALVHQVLTFVGEDEWFDQCRHGPGSSVGVKFDDTSLEAKFTFPISSTARVAPMMTRYLAHNFQMRAAVRTFNSDNPVTGLYSIVTGSRATTVEKNSDIRRMIAIEPTANMFLQQGLMHCMYKRMAKFGLDVRTLPDMHKDRARLSSITSQEATIDWSSASDCVSVELARFLLPRQWFAYCDMVRSPSIEIDGIQVELNMFSTMGNAVTFPLETLVFWAIGHACRTHLNGDLSLFIDLEIEGELSLVSVFGDDCIVPCSVAPLFIKTLEQLGFIVNDSKSFYDTLGFRESCGGDYLRGSDVRPYSLKAPTSTKRSALEPWLYIVTNSLIQKYILCFGELNYIYDRHVFKLIAKLFKQFGIRVKLVPVAYPMDAGLQIAFDLERFAQCYPMKFCRIGKSAHGTYDFSYMRFIYRVKEVKSEDIHYVQALQKPVLRESSPWRSIRKKGGYVVAKGVTCHWHVPQLN